MKTISAGLATHLAGYSTTIATCWKATLASGAIYGFTSHDRDLLVSGVTYKAATGQVPSAISSGADLAVDNLDVIGFLDSTTITEADLMVGKWDYAAIEIFQVNWADLTQGTIKLRNGRLGEVRVGRLQFVAELRGLSQSLQKIMGKIYSASCRANLGDSQCGIALASYTVTGTLTSVTSNRVFTDSGRAEAARYFEAGKITWTSGLNNGLKMEIKGFSAGLFTLQLEMPYTVAIGDTYSVYAGCMKRFTEDCGTKFNNKVNFRGEPHVPGNDQILKVGGLR